MLSEVDWGAHDSSLPMVKWYHLVCFVSFLTKQTPEFFRQPFRVKLRLGFLLGPLGIGINPVLL